MPYALADRHNGVIETFPTLEAAEAAMQAAVKEGADDNIRNAPDLTLDEAHKMARDFYLVMQVDECA